jgi:hypothetical protein
MRSRTEANVSTTELRAGFRGADDRKGIGRLLIHRHRPDRAGGDPIFARNAPCKTAYIESFRVSFRIQ